MTVTNIEWTDETWNPVTGCTKVSPGCAHCYAETFAERFRGVPGHSFEQGFDLKLWPERLTKPFTWKKPRKVFVNSMSDLFHEAVPFEFIDRVFAVMALTPQHTYQVLTKRPERMREYLTGRGRPVAIEAATRALASELDEARGWKARLDRMIELEGSGEPNPYWPLPNVWLGTSVENQHWADIRIPELLATPAAVRFLSCEPLLGPLSLTNLECFRDHFEGEEWDLKPVRPGHMAGLDWIIVGGESGPKARPFDLAWARAIVAQCRAAGVAVFVNQLGAKPYYHHSPQCPNNLLQNGVCCGHGLRLKSRKGGDMAEWPEDLRVRAFPAGAVQ